MTQDRPLAPPQAGGPQSTGRSFDTIVVVIGLLATLGMFVGARAQENRLSLERTSRIADDHFRAVQSEFNDQRLVLEAVRSLWAASEQVERDEFRAFVPPLIKRFPRLRSIEWVPALEQADLAALEQQAQEDGLADFQVHEVNADGRRVPVGPRQSYYPILYVSPLPVQPRGLAPNGGLPTRGNPARDRVLGFDRGTDPKQLVAFEEAAVSGERQTSGPHNVGELRVFHTTIPVYAGPGVPSSPTERSETLLGFVVGSFDAQAIYDLAQARFGELPIGLEIVDDARGVSLKAFPGSDGSPAADDSNATPTIDRGMDLGGATWTFRYTRLNTMTGFRHTVSWVLLGFGLLLTALLMLHLRSAQEREQKLAGSNRALTRQIQERHAAEAKSREAQRALTTLFSNLPGMAYRCKNDPDWTMEFLSDGCLPLTGYHPAELQSNATSYGNDVIAEADREQVWNNVQRALERKEPFQLIYRIVTKGGEERWVWEQGQGVFDDGETLSVIEGFVADITAQKTAEQGLRKEKHFSDTAIDSLPGVFYLFNEAGQYLRWNHNLERVSGYGRDEISAMSPLEMITADEREIVGQRINQVFESGSAAVEAHLETRSGELIPYFFTGQRITLDGQQCVVGMGVDVTARVRAEEERQSIQRKVLETQKLESVGLLAGGIAHDFNNLLTTMVGNLRFARDRIPESSKAREFVDLAGQAADRAGDLTRQLLAYTGRANFERIPVDLSEHIRKIAPLLQSSISKKVSLKLKLDEALPAVEADPTQLQQIAMNLVLNGAEACGEAAGVVRVRTETRTLETGQLRTPYGEALPAGRYVALVVEDTGCGMDSATRAKIFDPFYTTKFTGRGLGLAAVLGIVRGHDGALEVSSSPGRGSSFEILLPASVRPSLQQVEPMPQDLSGHGRILVVDDEASVLRVVTQTLTDCGYEVLQARNGRQAVDLFRRHGDTIDMVLLDQTMPEMNGAEALRAIHALRPEVPALLSSGYDEEQATRDALGAGLAGFIQKPYPPEALAAKVKEILTSTGVTPSKPNPLG